MIITRKRLALAPRLQPRSWYRFEMGTTRSATNKFSRFAHAQQVQVWIRANKVKFVNFMRMRKSQNSLSRCLKCAFESNNHGSTSTTGTSSKTICSCSYFAAEYHVEATASSCVTQMRTIMGQVVAMTLCNYASLLLARFGILIVTVLNWIMRTIMGQVVCTIASYSGSQYEATCATEAIHIRPIKLHYQFLVHPFL